MASKRKYEDLFEDDLKKEEANNKEVAALFQTSSGSSLTSRQTVKGKVVSINPDGVTVDIGFKSEGIIEPAEFMGNDGKLNLKVGDEVDVFIESLDSDTGDLVLSRSKAAVKTAWDELFRSFNDGVAIEGRVTGLVKGGLNVNIMGIKAFMPASQLDIKNVRNVDEYVGELVTVKVITCDRKHSNIVVSRKQILTEQRAEKKKEILSELKEGSVFKGRVKNITDYGIFVDIGGMDGLVHITDISWGRLKHPSDVVSVGSELDVIVLKYEPETDKLTLGAKQLKQDPWVDFDKRHKAGDRVKGSIVGMTDFGAFLEIETGVEGMIHVSELSWSGKVKKPSQVLKMGDSVEAVILDMNTSGRRISLGLKQINPNPWDLLKEKYSAGARVKGKVKNIADFGMFLDIGEEFDAIVRPQDVLWEAKASEVFKNYKPGQEIDAVFLGLDSERNRIVVGIKQLTEDPWLSIPGRYPEGKEIEGTIVKLTDFGVFVELEPSIDGLVHISEIGGKEKPKKLSDVFKVGERIKAIVVSVNAAQKRISLSVRALKTKEERENVEKFGARDKDIRVSLGDLIKEKMSQPGE
jgi:small subunit ribosomal protein S1